MSSSPESAMITISNLDKCPVKELIIHDIRLDSNCITMLSETIASNKPMKMVELLILLTIDLRH